MCFLCGVILEYKKRCDFIVITNKTAEKYVTALHGSTCEGKQISQGIGCMIFATHFEQGITLWKACVRIPFILHARTHAHTNTHTHTHTRVGHEKHGVFLQSTFLCANSVHPARTHTHTHKHTHTHTNTHVWDMRNMGFFCTQPFCTG